MTKFPDIISGYDLESRLRSIAMNAVRESLIAHGRYDAPVTDSDAAVMDNIFKLLHIKTEKEIDRSIEHHAISDQTQKQVPAALTAISSMLDKIHDEESAEVTQIAKVKIASTKA
jgi:hypothetical protein